MSNTLLLVEDEIEVLTMNERMLKRRGFTVLSAQNMAEAMLILEKHIPDMLILDIMLPDGNGYYICKKFRELSENPVIFLSAKGNTFDKVEALDYGADYYLTKPYDFDEFFAVINRLLARKENQTLKVKNIYNIGGLSVNKSNMTTFLNGKELFLTPTEFKLLSLLLNHINKLVGIETIYNEIWQSSEEINKGILKTHISRLRQKIDCDNSDSYNITSSYGRGYSFITL